MEKVMVALIGDEEDMVELNLLIKVPRHFPLGMAGSLEESVSRAVNILVRSNKLQEIFLSVDNVARLVVTQVRPTDIMLEQRIAQMAAVRKVFEEGEWLTAKDVNQLQQKPAVKNSFRASDWKRRGRIFSVSYDGKDYYPRYQFDAMYQPLPVISKILKAYGECVDMWSLAMWFHYPNGWIAKEGRNGVVPVAPKDALDRVSDVVEAAHKQKGTYVA